MGITGFYTEDVRNTLHKLMEMNLNEFTQELSNCTYGFPSLGVISETIAE